METIRQEQNPNGWLLDKRINIAHLLTTAVIIVGIFRWASVLENRLVQQEERLAGQQAMVAATQVTNERQMDLIRGELNIVRSEIVRTNTKLDRILEAQLGPSR